MNQTYATRERPAPAARRHGERAGALRPGSACPEVELLLCCARTCRSAAAERRARELLQGPIDWPLLGRLVYRHRVTPLLYQSFSALQAELPPDALRPDVLTQLRRFYHWNGFINHLRTDELLRILELFSAHDIIGIPFKGPILAASVYGDLALRQFADLDILIQPAKLREAERLIKERGYQLLPSTSGLSDWQEEAYLEITHQLAYWRADDTERRLNHVVELQWKFASHYFSSPLLPAEFWRNPVTTTLKGKTVRTFATEDLLLFLCLHGTRHVWSRLQWTCDVAELLRRHPDLDWQRVITRAEDLGLRRILLLGLHLAHELLEAPLPELARSHIRADPAVHSLAELVWLELFDQNQQSDIDPDSATQPLRVRRFHLLARERIRDKAQYFIRGLIPTQKDWSFLALPRSAGFLYYLLRPVRIARDFFSPS